MKKYTLMYEIAKWEFQRWFKLKEQVTTLLISVVVSSLIFGGQALLGKLESKVNLVVINESTFSFTLRSESKTQITWKNISEIIVQKKLLAEEEIDGILIIRSIEDIELTVNSEPYWLTELQEALTQARREVKLKESNISSADLDWIFSPAPLKLNVIEGVIQKTTFGEKVVAGIFIGMMLMGIFTGLAYQFVAITGEKQKKITEVIVSAISPQKWIDGKIIGISLLSLVIMVTYMISTIIFVLISLFFGSGWSIPLNVSNPILFVKLALLSVGGFLFWNTFFTAIASTINDPNTSARSSLMVVPIIPVGSAFLAFFNPDTITMKVLSIFPLTSSPVLTARMVLTDVSNLEVVSALVLLALSIWYLRIFSGKIFAASILRYGKEPSWKEMYRWIKES